MKTMQAATKDVWAACCELVGKDASIMDEHASMFDMGIDSLGLAELVIQLEELYGEGALSIDDVLANPVVSAVAAKLTGGKDTGAYKGAPAKLPPVEVSDTGRVAARGAMGPPTADKLAAVWAACCALVGNEGAPIDKNASLMDLGIDSLGLAELVIQLEELFGEGCIAVDDILASPIVSEVAAKLAGATSCTAPASKATPAAPPAPKLRPASIVAPAKPVRPKSTPTPTKPAAPAPRTPAPRTAATEETAASPVAMAILARLDQMEANFSQLKDVVKSLTPQKDDYDILPAAPGVTPSFYDACIDDTAAAVAPPPPADWILTTHVGSLPRAIVDPATGEITVPELDARIIIDQQRATGLSVINDGEWSRENYIADLLSRLRGVGSDDGRGDGKGLPSCLCEMPVAEDMRAVPTYAKRFTGGNGLITLNPRRIAMADQACTAWPTYLGTESLFANLTPFLDGLKSAGVPLERAFWGCPSPGTLATFCQDDFFCGDHAAYVAALAEAVRPEYEAVASTGVLLQIDCPDLAMGRHTRFTHLSDAEFAAVMELNVKALNAALVNVPREQVRIHVCWGNYAGPHHLDIDCDDVWPVVANIKCKYVLMEGANPRHGHDAAAYERAVSSGLIDPTKTTIVPGVIDTTAARVEHPQLIAERLLRYVKAAGHPTRVLAGTDCGFASTAKSTAITADLAWMKLAALVEGAALASRLYMQAQAPVPTKGPTLTPTPFRVCVLVGGGGAALHAPAARALVDSLGFSAHERSSLDVVPVGDAAAGAQQVFETLRWAVDFPLALVAYGAGAAAVAVAAAAAKRAASLLRSDSAASRRPSTVFVCGPADAAATALKSQMPPGSLYAGDGSDAAAIAALVSTTMLDGTGFDRRTLALGANPKPLPDATRVVVIGGGLLGMVAAHRLLARGHEVVILEQRTLVGGIWSMHANSTSQVNSSEGGYCLKEFLPESSPRKHAHNRDHSTAAEVLRDLAELGQSLKDVIHTQVQVAQVLGSAGDYQVICMQHGATAPSMKVIKCEGVVLAINDRVGLPRSLAVPGMDEFHGIMADGTSDLLKGTDWTGKRVVVFGMGAFAVENVRTALEGGAAHVTVVARRLGTICPKMIDYLNFVKPWDAQYRHDTATNVKQLQAWRSTYTKCGAATPEVWPTKIKHDGHTISVSDIWFVAHHMGKLTTHSPATLERMAPEGCVLTDGTFLPCDVVVGCIGFERNTTFCEQLTGRDTIMHSNYLDKNMIYLADAEIDESAFNSFFGSSVLEYAKFYTNVFVEGFERPDALGDILWGPKVEKCPVHLRKWTQYIAVGGELIDKDPACAKHAADQVANRTVHFYQTMPPATFVEVNRQEWEEIHTRLNGGVPVPKERQLPYMFNAAASWCAPAEEILGA